MKNTTIQESSYPLPVLRVAFRNEEAADKKNSKPVKKKEKEEKPMTHKTINVQPQFNDYRIKARDHDPL